MHSASNYVSVECLEDFKCPKPWHFPVRDKWHTFTHTPDTNVSQI